MRTALDAAGLDVSALSAVWANATGLPAVDRPEDAAIKRLLGHREVAIRKPKLVLGEPIGAGAQQFAALALQEWDNGGDIGPVLINSSSLGGTHIALIMSPERK